MAYDDDVASLANKIETAQYEMAISNNYYEARHRLTTIGLSAPPELQKLNTAVGLPRLYIDAIEERLDVEGFRLAGKAEHLDQFWTWWQANDLDELSSSAHLEAMIYGRSYVTVSHPGDRSGVPIIRVESPTNMTAVIDPRTQKVTKALRLYRQDVMTPAGAAPDVDPNIERATLFLPNETSYWKKQNGKWVLDGPSKRAIVKHNLGRVPVVPIFNRARLSDPNGSSEILPEIRAITDAASRQLMNLQAAAELMAMPQRYLFGVDPDEIAPNGSPAEVLDAYMARIIAVKDPEGKAGQFMAAELRNYVDGIERLWKDAAAYTGLPPQYLSFASDNPASAEAIRSAESRLVKKCERKARQFGGAWEEVMRLAMRIMGQEVGPEYDRLETIWRDPATPTYAAKADAVMKLYANGAGVIPKEYARIEMGFSDEQRRDMREWDREDEPSLDSMLRNIAPSAPPEPEEAQ